MGGENGKESSITLNLFREQLGIVYPDGENWRRNTRFGVAVGGRI